MHFSTRRRVGGGLGLAGGGAAGAWPVRGDHVAGSVRRPGLLTRAYCAAAGLYCGYATRVRHCYHTIVVGLLHPSSSSSSSSPPRLLISPSSPHLQHWRHPLDHLSAHGQAVFRRHHSSSVPHRRLSHTAVLALAASFSLPFLRPTHQQQQLALFSFSFSFSLSPWASLDSRGS